MFSQIDFWMMENSNNFNSSIMVQKTATKCSVKKGTHKIGILSYMYIYILLYMLWENAIK